jgi:tetratricopeptide (TPR) repeat protein
MKRYFLLPLLAGLLSGSLAARAAAQGEGQSGRGRLPDPAVTHTLYGDFKVDESKASGSKPGTFQLVLYTLAGHPIARQSINNNGRYYFNNVANGEYYLVVEVEGSEAARLPIRVDAIFKSEIRRDIALEWHGTPAASAAKGADITSTAAYYDRSPANQKLFEKAQEAIKKNDHQQATFLLNQILSADPKDYRAWTELGTLYFKQDKIGDAEKAYQRALAERPTFLPTLLNLAKLQLSRKNYEGAAETLSRAVGAEPRSAEAHLYLGEAYLQVKKGSTAVVHLNEALRLDPVGKAEAHLRLGALYRAAGMKDKAVAEYEQFLAKRPDHPDKEKIRQYIAENKRP